MSSSWLDNDVPLLELGSTSYWKLGKLGWNLIIFYSNYQVKKRQQIKKHAYR